MHTLKPSIFPFTLQCAYPDGRSMKSFLELLRMLSDHGFYGVEINLTDLRIPSPDNLLALLDSFGLQLTYLATGKYSSSHGYSLSSADPEVRRASIAGCKENIHYAAECGCGIIIGFFKNNPSTDTRHPEAYLEESLQELVPLAKRLGVPLLLEATNRYESKIANSLRQAADLARRIDPEIISILPDTYHMNIEESDPFLALEACDGLFPNIHFSDNNRFFPGFGCISFQRYLKKLKEMHYKGTIGIEGNLKYDYRRDLDFTVEYLSRISHSIPSLPVMAANDL